MSDLSISTITFLVLTVIPLLLFLLHIVLSTRKHWLWSLLVPMIWAALGTWILITNYKVMGFTVELFIFFAGGVLILAATSFLLRRLKNAKGKLISEEDHKESTKE